MLQIAAPVASGGERFRLDATAGLCFHRRPHGQGRGMTPTGRRLLAAVVAAILLSVLLACGASRLAAQDPPARDLDTDTDPDAGDADGADAMFSGDDDDMSSGAAGDGAASGGDDDERDRATDSFRGAGGSFDEGGHPRF